jgi:AcrR family transcriptional regulator
MTTTRQQKLSWRGEVLSVLGEARLTAADLARELGVHRATVHRYFRHRPKPETIRRVGEAVAALVLPVMRLDRMPDEPADDKMSRARSDVTDYLHAIALSEFGDKDEAADVGLQLGLNFIEAFLEHTGVERVKAALARHTRREAAGNVPRHRRRATKLGLRMLVELRRIAFDIARASYPTASRFDRIARIFETVDDSLNGKLVPKSALLPMLIYERFHARMAETIARHVKGRDERLHFLDDVDLATRDLIDELNEKIIPALIKGGNS